MQNPAVFIIDMVNDSFVHDRLIARRADLCASINELLAHARERDFDVLWVRQEYEQDLSDAPLDMRDENIHMYLKGTSGSALIDELEPDPGEETIIKKRYSMFFETGLDEILRDLEPSMLVLAGVNTHACIRTAAVDAYQRDYRTWIVRECVDSKDEEHHEISLDYMSDSIARVVTLAEFQQEFP